MVNFIHGLAQTNFSVITDLDNTRRIRSVSKSTPKRKVCTKLPSDTPFSLKDEMYRGYFPLWRKITDWGWYKDSNTKAVFIHLMLSANIKDNHFLGHKILRGQCVSGRKTLSSALGLSEMQIRTAIKHLKATSEITIKNYNKFSIITLINFEKYHPSNQQSTSEISSKQPADNQQITTPDNDKNDKNDNNSSASHLPKRAQLSDNDFITHFNALWNKYPSKIGKEAARRHYTAKVTTEEDKVYIEKALNNYIKSRRVKQGYIQNGSTWFNNWRDWIDYSDPKDIEKEEKERNERFERIMGRRK